MSGETGRQVLARVLFVGIGRQILARALCVSGVVMAVLAFGASPPAWASLPACTVTWTGGGSNNLWSNPANWSTRTVPGAASDVCINTFALVGATPPISVHSLQVSNGASLYFNGGSAGAAIAIATVFSNQAYVSLEAPYTVTAGSIDNTNGIDVLANSTITSKAFSNTGTLAAIDGTARLTYAPRQLSNGNLTAGTWDVLNGRLVLPQDITTISGGQVSIAQQAAIQDAAGHDALAGLSSIGPAGTFVIDGQGSVALTGNLVSQGQVELGSYAGGGATLSIAGSYTQESGARGVLFEGTLEAKSINVGAGSGLTGQGTVVGPVTNAGTIAPANQLAITGSFTQTAGGVDSQYFGSKLSVSGKASLAGALDLSVNPRCPPPVGATFTAVSYGSRSGKFATHTAGFGVSYGLQALTVTYQG